MSYDPTEWVPQTPGQPPAQPPDAPAYGQPPQPPATPAYGQPPQPPIAPTVYGGAAGNLGQPQYGQPGNPGLPQYGQPSNPGLPQYGQPSNPGLPQYGQPSNPGLPQYGQPSSPDLPQYGQPSSPNLPQYGQPSSPTFPQYGQPGSPGLPQYGQPSADPYAQQQAQPWGAAVPPGYVPPAAPPKKSSLRIWLILLVVVVVLGAGGGGLAYYFATRPKPVITVASKYLDGPTAVAASSTDFTLTGNDFTANSAISVLLDGVPAPGVSGVQSDGSGKVSATVKVTDAWTVGSHTLTAKDASGYTTNTGVKIEVVTPGQSKTPGPNGAPTDSASMNIVAIVTAGSSSGTLNLAVTGGANGGTVCATADDGQSHTRTGTASGVAFTETITRTCTGTYKGGKLDYTETVTSDKIDFANGLSCTAQVPYVNGHLQGTFSDAATVKGDYSEGAITLNCNLGVGSQTTQPNTGTWLGTAVQQ